MSNIEVLTQQDCTTSGMQTQMFTTQRQSQNKVHNVHWGHSHEPTSLHYSLGKMIGIIALILKCINLPFRLG